ncbi:hypothetical protein CVT26_006862 [Gymnopilus dilepis]|uniref:Glycoside hydrolase family 5 domain-containing protein n=1 Tax=Gymnopilus dilepis TaxID=231916 RepID=A0A409W0T8_9AGAR|nr:hypothetical protein CVT26_006862 [Gymnopilus dilepis]
MSTFLRVKGNKLVDGGEKQVILRGAGLGGWMNTKAIRDASIKSGKLWLRQLARRSPSSSLTRHVYRLSLHFQDADAAFFKSLGLNCIRLPFNYRHFEDDMNPRVFKESGFKHLDRVIEICAQHGIYTILDLHTAPGGQNPDWHSDNGGHIANFWNHKDFQDRVLWLWGELAKHYKDNKWIAGYNPLNEPADPKHIRLIKFYDDVYSAIRSVDPNHIIFFDGDTFASDFSHFGDAHQRWSNTAYSIHDYSTFGFPKAPEYVGSDEQKDKMKDRYVKKRQWMDERGLCVWNGEWGPVYARKQYDGEPTDATERSVHNRLDTLSWSIWLYKDIGFQGMVYTSLDTPYLTLFKDFLAKKHRLAADAWGADDTAVKHVYQPLLDHILSVVPEQYQNIYPWSPARRLSRLTRDILVSEFLVKEWADHFVGKSEAELDELAKSFRFQNCVKREELNAILSADAREQGQL